MSALPVCRSLATIAVLAAAAAVAAPPAAAQSIRINESVDALEQRARQDSTDGVAQYNVAIGYMSRRQWARADSALSRATALEPSLAIAWLARAIVWDRDDNYWRQLRRQGGDSAVRREARLRTGYSRRAFLIEPLVDLRILGSIRSFEDYGDAIQFYLGQDFRRFADGVRLGAQGLVEGDYERANNGFTLASVAWNGLTRRDTMPEWLLFYRGLAAAHTNRMPSAIGDFMLLLDREVAEERKDSTRFAPLRTNEYRYMLATLQVRAQQPALAIPLFEEVLENDIGNYMAHVQLARIHESRREWDRAIAARRSAAEINPEDHTVQFDLGAVYTRAGRWADAEDALLRAREMQPRYARTWYALGISQQQLGKRDAARESLNHFIALAPSRMANQVTDARQRLAQLQ